MDGQRFDDLARLFGASLNRKRFLTLVAGIVAPAALADDVVGARRAKRRKGGNRGGGDVDPQGTNGPICGGSCTSDGACDNSPLCVCDEAEGVCVQAICGGPCVKDDDCPTVGGCRCEEKTGQCVTGTCGGPCDKGECPEGGGCVCNTNTDECVTVSCPGFCDSNDRCQEAGQGNCACFFDPVFNVRSADFGTEGKLLGFCSTCREPGDPCFASTECCGQLVCRGAGGEVGDEGVDSGTCVRKPKPKPQPKERCSKHGQDCERDSGCCAQAVCFKGECGEKDTHCKNDRECARGYRCQGGPLSPGHRRCRKNGRRNRNRRNPNGKKR